MFNQLKDNKTYYYCDYYGFQHESPAKHSHLFNNSFHDTVFLQIGSYVFPMQNYMYCNRDHKDQCSPFMDCNKEMSDGN